jgi:hypothetical protein
VQPDGARGAGVSQFCQECLGYLIPGRSRRHTPAHPPDPAPVRLALRRRISNGSSSAGNQAGAPSVAALAACPQLRKLDICSKVAGATGVAAVDKALREGTSRARSCGRCTSTATRRWRRAWRRWPRRCGRARACS